jgi:geranylgeranyl diphosphate synthase type II
VFAREAGVQIVSVFSSSELDAPELLQQHGQVLAEFFGELGERFPGVPARLMESIQYSLMAGGKRLRPALVLECWRACRSGKAAAPSDNGDGSSRSTSRGIKRIKSDAGKDSTYGSALAAAAAIELIHTFSLVHDDLPAMDDDDLRRGQPTNHKVFGEAMAILAGDAMVTMAFEIIATDADPSVAPALLRELASASGPAGMIGGQVLDIDSENVALRLEQLQQLHRMKTGALLTAACRLGAIAAGAEPASLRAVTEFGQHMGLAFQIVDDLLDVTSTPEQLGKATRKDADKGKNTYPTLLGIEGSRREADAQLAAARVALDVLGSAADTLRTLAGFVVRRST